MAIEITVQSGPGPAGVGVPTGGTTNQVLAKASNTNFDTAWVDAGGGPTTPLTGIASEDLAIGDFVNVYNSSGIKVRKASGTNGHRADGFVASAYTNGQTVTIEKIGSINVAVTGKTPGARQWLSATAGLSTETPLSGPGQLVQSLGWAQTATSMEFVPNQPILLAGVPIPVNTVPPVISGANLIVGTQLTSTTGTWVGGVTYSYQWMRSGVDIGAPSLATYTLQVADIGSTITCRVVATNASGSGLYAESNALGPILIQVPSNSVAPVVTAPSLVVGVTATSTSGTWSNSPSGYAYQWYRGGSTLIVGETSNTYVLATADIGLNITCRVIASNSTGPGTEVTSNSIGPVVAVSLMTTSIAITRTSGPAPFAVNVDAINTVSPLTTRPFDECAFDWDFGETGLGNWDYGAQAGTLSKNLEQGPLAGHIYETPGTYTITLNATDGTNSASNTVVVTVTDPDVVYSGTNTVCIANGTLPVSGVNGVPTGALCYNETTWAGVLSRFSAGKRILLKRGDSWTTIDQRGPTTAASATPTQVGAYGSGANPVINHTVANAWSFWLNNVQSRYDFRDLKFVGTELVNTVAIGGSTNVGFSALRIECYLMGTTISIGSGSVGQDYGDIVIQDCNMHESFSEAVIFTPGVDTRGSGKVGIWMNNVEHVSLIGNRIYNMRAIEHCVRTQGAGKALYAHNWTDSPGVGKHCFAIRGKVLPDYPRLTQYIRTADNLMTNENNPSIDRMTQFGPQSTQYIENQEDCIVEDNWVRGSYQCSVYSEFSGRLTVRNNLFQNSGAGYPMDFNGNYTNVAGTTVPHDTRVYNNTSYHLITATIQYARLYGSLASKYTGLTVKNNLIYAPNIPGTAIILALDAGVDTITNTASNNSTPSQVKTVSPLLVANPPVVVGDWKPTGSSYALTGGAVVPVLKDFFNFTKTSGVLGACNQ